jgi:hypothetical protein
MRAECERLLPVCQTAYEPQYPPELPSEGKRRQRSPGGGTTGTLGHFADTLLFILVSQTTNPLPVMPGLQGALRPSPAHSWRHRFLPGLQHALRALGQAPEREAPRVETSAWALAGAPPLAVDGTARRRQRPRDASPHKEQDSGKKKTPTDTNLLLSNAHPGQGVSLGPTLPGKTHDKKAVEATPMTYRTHPTRDQDTGCQGYEPGGVWTTQPQQSPQAQSEQEVQSAAIASSPGYGWWSNT